MILSSRKLYLMKKSFLRSSFVEPIRIHLCWNKYVNVYFLLYCIPLDISNKKSKDSIRIDRHNVMSFQRINQWNCDLNKVDENCSSTNCVCNNIRCIDMILALAMIYFTIFIHRDVLPFWCNAKVIALCSNIQQFEQ